MHKKTQLPRTIIVMPKVDKTSASEGKTLEELPKTEQGPPLACVLLPARKGLAPKTSEEKRQRVVQEATTDDDTPQKAK
ncbi:hypothetical protein R1flu_000984 [Riccia fluitans]|uniref:Uncharacterized protein n=1 Tax=Riccia fluitans TaxID=41844 RepID=A0ABD1Y613_9MARC